MWRETKIGNVLPWEDIEDEAERLLALGKGSQKAVKEGHNSEEQENDQEVERDETDPTTRSFLGEGDLILSVVVDWANKVLYVLEIKRTSDQRRDDRERGESQAMAQNDILVRSLEKVAEDTEEVS